MKFRFVFILLLALVGLDTVAQSDGSAGRKQKQAAKAKKEQVRKQEKAEKKGRKRHFKIQSKDVQKRWKKNNRRYKHVDAYDRRPNLWQRIFPRKRPENK
jgi:hypothetical protein